MTGLIEIEDPYYRTIYIDYDIQRGGISEPAEVTINQVEYKGRKVKRMISSNGMEWIERKTLETVID